MKNFDYLHISNDKKTIENFANVSTSAINDAFGSGSVTNRKTSGGGKQFGSFGYASINPITGAMSGISNPQPNSTSGLGITKGGAKTSSFSGGSFNGYGREVVGFPGIREGSSLPAMSMPSLYMKPKLVPLRPKFFKPETVQDVTLPYGHIEKHINQGIPGPRITNKYDNVGCNFATELRGPKFPYGFDLKDKNLTGYYGYSGYGYETNGGMNDPFYWGLGPYYPLTGVILDYPDPPFDYETLMQKEINSDNLVNTIQNQLATQFMEEDQQKEAEKRYDEMENAKETSTTVIDKKESFESENQSCNRNNIIIILAVVLIIYILLSIPTTETERNFSL